MVRSASHELACRGKTVPRDVASNPEACSGGRLPRRVDRELIDFFQRCDMDGTDLRRVHPEIDRALDELGVDEG